MPRTRVSEDQFEVRQNEVIHLPTNARWSAYPGRPDANIRSLGMLGSVLPNGDDYRQDEVERIALRLLAERPLN